MRDLSVVSVSGRSALLNYILKIVHKDDDLDESVSLLVYASSYNLNMCTLKLRFLQKEPMLRQTRKATKKTLLDVVIDVLKCILIIMHQDNIPRNG